MNTNHHLNISFQYSLLSQIVIRLRFMFIRTDCNIHLYVYLYSRINLSFTLNSYQYSQPILISGEFSETRARAFKSWNRTNLCSLLFADTDCRRSIRSLFDFKLLEQFLNHQSFDELICILQIPNPNKQLASLSAQKRYKFILCSFNLILYNNTSVILREDMVHVCERQYHFIMKIDELKLVNIGFRMFKFVHIKIWSFIIAKFYIPKLSIASVSHLHANKASLT